MQDFDSIRPFDDHEVPEVISRVLAHPEFGRAASKVVMPKTLQGSSLGDWVTTKLLAFKTRDLTTVDDCQLFLADYFQRLVEETVTELSVSGLDQLDPKASYLFMSNHRDIVMDSGLLNFIIHNAGHDTCRMAVGDNLLGNDLAADLMRLNKSFVVERSVTGARASLAAYTRTSSYIRHSLEENVSIWIAQRAGRAKDGLDKTDPALLKMLTLAYKDCDKAIDGMIEKIKLVPVSISYELDPCAGRKAHELSVTEDEGQYDKSDEEDLQSIIIGIVGQKGRVHLHFGEPISGQFENPEDLAQTVDRAIVGGLRVFPTHVEAARELGDQAVEAAQVEPLPEVMAQFSEQLHSAPDTERPFLLVQYANVIRNRLEVGAAGL